MHRVNYILVRLLQMIPVALGITIILFFLLRAIPGDPAAIRLGIRATPEGIANLDRQLGLDKPIWTQYFIFLGDLLKGDFGDSFMYSVPVLSLIEQRMPLTLFLAAYATAMSIVISVPMAMIAALKKDQWLDNLIRGGFMLALGAPQFWLGIIMLLLFSLWIPIFPISGFGETVGDHFMHLTLPAFTLALAQSSWLVRSLRSDVINVLQADYVDFARAKGLRERFIFLRHILRNSLLPTLTILGVNVGYLVGGAVVIERVFGIPGMGSLMLDAIFGRDYTVVQGATFCFALLVIGINLLTDLTYSFLDPRVTLG